MKEIIYNSFLSDSIKEYIRFKCSLGYSASTYDEALRRFDVFCIENYPSANAVTEEIVNHWIEKRASENTNGHIRRMITLKGFLSFLRPQPPSFRYLQRSHHRFSVLSFFCSSYSSSG